VDWTWVLFFFFGVVGGRRLGRPGFVGGVRVQGRRLGGVWLCSGFCAGCRVGVLVRPALYLALSAGVG
jgi:hypothetical protein